MNKQFIDGGWIFFYSFFVILILSGCSAPQLDLSLNKTLIPSLDQHPAIVTRLGVDAFVDLRPQRRGSDNEKWKGLIPGMLWIEIASDMPEIYTAYSPYNSRPMNFSLAEAVADTLSQAGASNRVVLLPEDPYQQVDYRLEGIIRRTNVIETGYYYGSTLYVWLFRVFGFPYVSYRFDLVLDLRLRSLESDEILWKGRIEGNRRDKYRNVYELSAGEQGKHLIAYNFSEILAEHLVPLVPQIKQALTEPAR